MDATTVGVITAIAVGVCGIAGWILENLFSRRLTKVELDLASNFKQDEDRHNGLGKRIDKVDDKLEEKAFYIAENYAKNQDLKELKADMKAMEKTITDELRAIHSELSAYFRGQLKHNNNNNAQ